MLLSHLCASSLALIFASPARASTSSPQARQVPTESPDKIRRSVSSELFNELDELSRLVGISYCVGSQGIQKPFTCLSHCDEFPGLQLVQVRHPQPHAPQSFVQLRTLTDIHRPRRAGIRASCRTPAATSPSPMRRPMRRESWCFSAAQTASKTSSPTCRPALPSTSLTDPSALIRKAPAPIVPSIRASWPLGMRPGTRSCHS